MRKFLTVFSFLAVVSLVFGGVVFAQQDFGFGQANNIGEGAFGTTDIRDVIVNVVNIALGFLGIIATIILMYGGYLWMTAGGSPDRVEQAKRTLRNAAIGLAVIVASWALTTFLISQFSQATGGSLGCQVGVTYNCTPVAGGCGTQSCFDPGTGIGQLGTCFPTACTTGGGAGLVISYRYPLSNINPNVCTNTVIIAGFNENIDPGTIAGNVIVRQCNPGPGGCAANGYATPPAGIAGTINSSGPSVVFTPASNLVANREYEVTVVSDAATNTGIAGIPSGNRLASGNDVWYFTSGSTQDLTPPTIPAPPGVTTPYDGETNVCLETYLEAEFSEVMNPITFNGSSVEVTSNANIPTYSVGANYYSSATANSPLGPHHSILAVPQTAHDSSSNYFVRVDGSVEDACQNPMGNSFGSDVSGTVYTNPWSFLTGLTVQCIPEINQIIPVPGGAGTDGYYDATDSVNIVGRYLTPALDVNFGNNATAVINSCLQNIPNQYQANSACLISTAGGLIQTRIPSSQAAGQGALTGTVRVRTPVATAASPSVLPIGSPFISSINSGRFNGNIPAAAPTNFISIFGRNFDNFTPSTPEVWFTEIGSSPVNRVQAILPCGPGSFSDTQMVVAFPGSYSGPYDRSFHVQVEINDGGVRRHSNIGEVYLDNAGQQPGLCPPVSPSSGPVGTGITLSGEQFNLLTPASTEVKFGQVSNGINAVGNPPALTTGPGLDLATGINVPSLQPSTGIGVFITDGTYTSNSLQFDVLGSVSGGPVIYDFTPNSGGLGQYVTITGNNFGQDRASVSGQVRFYNLANDPLGVSGGASYVGDFTFPLQCQNNIWNNTQIIVKVPLVPALPTGNYFVAVDTAGGIATSENLTTPQFTRNSAAPSPGVCSVSPSNGVVGQVVNVYGDNFGNSSGNVEFYNSTAPVNSPLSTTIWSRQDITNVDIPSGAESGPVFVYDSANRKSNPYNFSVGVCQPNSCSFGFSCCQGGDFDGQCRANLQTLPSVITSCDIQNLTSTQSWTFTSGIGPGTSCDADTTMPMCQPNHPRCNSSFLVCQQSSCTCENFGIVFKNDCTNGAQSPSPRPFQPDACMNSLISVQFNDSVDTSAANLRRITVEQCAAGSDQFNCLGPTTPFLPANITFTPGTTVVADDTLLIDPPGATLNANSVYRVTVPATFLSAGAAPFGGPSGSPYSWQFQTQGSICQPDSCAWLPPFGGSATSLISPGNTQAYLLYPGLGCNLLTGNFPHDISSDDTNIGVAAPSSVPSVPSVAPNMTAVGKGTTNIVGQNQTDASIICRAPFTVTTIRPEVIETYPNCDDACINAAVGVKFNTPILQSSVVIGNNISPPSPVYFPRNSIYLRWCGYTDPSATPYYASSATCGFNPSDPNNNNFWNGGHARLDPNSIIWINPGIDSAGRPTAEGFYVQQLGGQNLGAGAAYRLEIAANNSHGNGIHTPSGEYLAGDSPANIYNHGEWLTYMFQTKEATGANAICEPAYIQIEPENITSHAIGENLPVTGVAFGAPDNCSPFNGQRLNPFGFDWSAGTGSSPNGWNTADGTIAQIDFNGLGGRGDILGGLYNILPTNPTPPPDATDTLIDPVQYVTTIGTNMSCSTGSCSTQIRGAMQISAGSLSSNGSPPARNATITLQCGYTNDSQCVSGPPTGLNLNPTGLTPHGVASNTCCAPRPVLNNSNPPEGTPDVCRNQGFILDFSEEIDTNSARGNIFLAENLGNRPCPAGSNSLLVQAVGSTRLVEGEEKGPVRRFVDNVIDFFRGLFVNDVSAQAFYSTGDNLCIVPTTISVNNFGGSAQVTVSPNQLLKGTGSTSNLNGTPYVIVILGDDDPTDNVKRGLQSNIGVTFVGDAQTSTQGTAVTINRGGINHLSEVITFETDNDICAIEFISHSFLQLTNFSSLTTRTQLPHTFFCAGNSCPDDLGMWALLNDMPGNQHLLLIQPFDAANRPVVANFEFHKGGANFFETCPSDNGINAVNNCFGTQVNAIGVSAPGGLASAWSQIRVAEDLPGYTQDTKGRITVIAENAYDATNRVSKTLPINLFACSNPWPSVDTFPYVDSAANCDTGACQDQNFEFYYCRDSGGPGTEDDLPALSVDPVGSGQSTKNICYGGSNPTRDCSAQADCVCDPGDANCTSPQDDGYCLPAELKSLVFTREGVPTAPSTVLQPQVPSGLWPQYRSQQGGDVMLSSGAVFSGIIDGQGYKLYWGTDPDALVYSKDLGIAAPTGIPGFGILPTSAQFLQGLNPTQGYYFALTTYVRDPYGGAESKIVNIYPNPSGSGFVPRDVLAPVNPTITGSTSSGSAINLTWEPELTTAFEIDHYEVDIRVSGTSIWAQTINVQRGSESVDPVTSIISVTHRFNLTTGSTYDFRVRSVDAAGNASGSSNTWTQQVF